MSYTFSRRDFMKYSALTAVAVAGAGMFTGCSTSNPNRPSATYNAANDSTLTFGGTTGLFGGTKDAQTLKKGATYSATEGLACTFNHFAVSEGCSCVSSSYQIDIIDNNGNYKSYQNGSVCGEGDNKKTVEILASGGASGMTKEKTYEVKLTAKNIDYSNAKKVCIRYFPRHNALGNVNDSYSDVYATWDITSVIKG